MRNATLDHLNRLHEVVEAKDFSQHWFRRKNGIDPSMGLCAGLVQVWWGSVRKGEDGIAVLKQATLGLVKEIIARQLRSFYFGRTPNYAELGEETIFWLRAKYGTDDLRDIRSLCQQYGANELLELDLAVEHESIIVDRHSFSGFSAELVNRFTVPAEPGLRLLLLRYVHLGRRGGQCGHRLGMAVQPDGCSKFFDPNQGEITFKTLQQFRDWFADFWLTSEYKPRIEQPVADIPPLRLYRFGYAATCAAKSMSRTNAAFVGKRTKQVDA
jgi:Yersinia/Haemophilus virulence surface antigen